MTNDDWRDIVAELEAENEKLRQGIKQTMGIYNLVDPPDVIAFAMYASLSSVLREA